MYISYEGLDRTGKDSLMLAVDKKTHWANVNSMRGPVGIFTFDEVYNRSTKERSEEALEFIRTIEKIPHLIVYMKAPASIIQKRLEEEGKTSCTPDGWSIEEVLDLYEKNILKYYNKDNILIIDSSTMTIEEEVEAVISKIDELHENHISFKKEENISSINHRSLKNVEYTQFKPIQIHLTKSILQKYGEFDKTVDEPYYDMLEYSLKHILHERNLNWINDRQMVFTSNDCIPYVQIARKNDKIQYFVSQRSMDFNKHKYNDLLFFDYFNEKYMNDQEYELYYSCAYPHSYS